MLTLKRLGASSAAIGLLLLGCSTGVADDTAASADQVKQGTPGGEPGTGEGEPVVPVVEEDAELPVQWPNRGSADCQNFQNSDPSIYKFKLNANTFILRENKCLNFEGNFIYVLFGQKKVLIQDTGSIAQGMSRALFTQLFPIRNTIEAMIGEWLAAHPNEDGSPRTRDSIELLVSHTHSHGDHVSGDYQFKNADGTPLPYTKVAGLRPADVASFFGLTNWPNNAGSIDLGDRVVDVLPIPGHEASHVALYDHGSQLLLTGDTLYPGHIFIQDWGTFRKSTAKLAAWIKETDAQGKPVRPVKHVFGTHIEKKPGTGAASFYRYGTRFHPTERHLELTGAHVELEAQQAQSLGPVAPSTEQFFDDFSIDP
ncbi:MAG: MBL fold metallo-hydrolase [Labilithrix sp.]|nr:MBL fold metallo-hydrolase [Labilithrix sp.]MCW5813252.1 MBL fold metallo-hydrolase [Labilithrix sp.]